MKNYTKETVHTNFNGNGILPSHQMDFMDVVIFLSKTKPTGFTSDDVHHMLVNYCNRPETSNYTSFLTVLVEKKLLLKDENKMYVPSALFLYII